MELFDKHFGNTKEAFLRLHENFEELKKATDCMQQKNEKLQKKVDDFEEVVGDKVKIIEEIINKLNGAVE